MPIGGITAREGPEQPRPCQSRGDMWIVYDVFGVIKVDDPEYIIDNPHVTSGLTWPGLLWAFSSGYAANWHPLTWVSHMMDCSLYGLDPGGHHSTNLIFHVADVLLLFLLFCRMTGAVWRSALVAALFALRPLHVESVAWASERKDVLSTFFLMLTLLTYAAYARSKDLHALIPGEAAAVTPDSRAQAAPRMLGASLTFFALGLMSKPMLVTVPVLL